MKTREPPAESPAKGAGRGKRSKPSLERAPSADKPMDKFKQLARRVLDVPRDAVLEAEKVERKKRK